MTSELSLTNSLMTTAAFPIARVLGGALLCRAYGMISEYTGRDLQIGALLARIIPNQMVSFLERGSNILARPIHELQGFLYEHGYQQIAFSNWYANVIGPTLEEAIFRLGLQNGISFALRAVGVNDVLAEAIAIGASSFLFAQAHTTVLQSAEFSSTMISGAIYGAIQSLGGFHEAALAHVLFDSTIHINLNNIRDYIPFMKHHAE